MRYLVDSNIIIYHLNGNNKATDFLSKHKDHIAISQITYIEVLSYPFDEHIQIQIKKLLESFEIIDVTLDISKQAINNIKLKKIKVPDNIIASTAIINNLILVTRNTKDFDNLKINLLNPIDGENQ